MGTASLVIGLALIIIGFYIIIELLNSGSLAEDPLLVLLGMLVFGVPLIAGGALFLRKYDRDKKKEKSTT